MATNVVRLQPTDGTRQRRVEPYPFTTDFERVLALYIATKPPVFGALGEALDSKMLTAPEAQHVVDAAKAIALDVGRGPDASVLVVQRLRRWQDEGRVTAAQIVAVGDYLDAALDGPQFSEEACIEEVAAVLRHRMRGEAVMAAIDGHGKRGDLEKAAELIGKANRVGRVDVSPGLLVGGGAALDIERLRTVSRLKSGQRDYDFHGANVARGELGVAIAESGGGKSMWLNQVYCHGLRQQLFCGYVTLELPEPLVMARVLADLCDVPIDTITESAAWENEERAAALPGIGRGYVRYFPGHGTTVEDIIAWVEQTEATAGQQMDLLVIDYADKLTVKGSDSEYTGQRSVYEHLRTWLVRTQKFCWTASQATRAKQKRLDMEHVADSMHKVRIADLIATLNVTEHENGDREGFIFVAKFRTGKSRFTVGPLAIEYSHGRFAAR
jgi:KaiC/GvpD/RAD55 family RecA-like ATPase